MVKNTQPIINRADAAIAGDAVQDQTDDESADDGDDQDLRPMQARDKAVQMRGIIRAVDRALNKVDAKFERHRRCARGDAKKQRDEPKLHLAGATQFQHQPSL